MNSIFTLLASISSVATGFAAVLWYIRKWRLAQKKEQEENTVKIIKRLIHENANGFNKKNNRLLNDIDKRLIKVEYKVNSLEIKIVGKK